MFFGLNPPSRGDSPSKLGMVGAGGVIGFGSAWFGIGGGSFTVPYLIWIKRPMHYAVATSAACGFPIAVSGALVYAFLGWDNPHLDRKSTRLNSSHVRISYAVFCLKKKTERH